MEWLSPGIALTAAAATVPLLLLMYFLKLKRQEQLVSSTLLWKRAIQDLQVNAPFQRLRKNLLLWLQMLILIAVLLALAGPILSLQSGPAQKYVLLLDRSASMNTVESGSTRLEIAKKQAKIFLESLRDKSFFSFQEKSDQAMVIVFDTHAKVICNFTSDRRQLLAAVEAITPSDGSSSLAEAITVARAFAQSPGEDNNNRNTQNPAHLILFSDGHIHDLDRITLGPDEMRFQSIGQANQNIALTAMQARREYENPESVNIFATLANYGTTATTCDVQLSINGNVQAIKSVPIPARRSESATQANPPGKVSVHFTLTYADAGILELRQLQSDSLASDDAAWTLVSPPKKLSLLLVCTDNDALELALRSCPLAQLTTCSPAEFDSMEHSLLSIEQPYDLIVLDNHIPRQYPRCRYLIFGQPPKGIGVRATDQLTEQVIIDWRSQHPLMKSVTLTNLYAAKCYQMALPRDAEVLAEFEESPAIALLRRHGSIFLLVGFDVLQTNWPFDPGFVIFCYNAAHFLGIQTGPVQQTDLQVGEPFIVEGLSPETIAQVEKPGIATTQIKANPGGSIRFSGTDRVGMYRVKIPDQPHQFFAVNLLDEEESDIKPLQEIFLAGESLETQSQVLSRSNLPLWPYLVAFALFVVCLEWIVYNTRIRL